MLAIDFLWTLYIKLINVIEYMTTFQFEKEVFIFAFEFDLFFWLICHGAGSWNLCTVINIK